MSAAARILTWEYQQGEAFAPRLPSGHAATWPHPPSPPHSTLTFTHPARKGSSGGELLNTISANSCSCAIEQRQRLAGELKNTRLYNVLGWGTCAMSTTAVVVMLGGQLLELFGVQLFGG